MPWIRPSYGLLLGIGSANKDDDGGSEKKGNAGWVIGNLAVQLGLLGGGVIGFGQRFGFYTGLQGALSLIPFLGMGFLAVPVGIHFNKRFGVGIVLPIFLTQWWIGLLAGIGLYFLASMLSKKYG